MADQISFNPGATGFRGICGTLIYRNQWIGFENAPSTILFNAQMNLQKIGAGVGISFMNDRVGFQSETDFKINFAKHFEVVGYGYLSAGIGLGLESMGFKPTWIPPQPGLTDINLPTEVSQAGIDINLGLFWRGTSSPYYIGLSTTHITAPELKTVNFKKARHYYATGGLDIDYDMLPLVSGLTLKPSMIIYSDLVSTSMDITLIADYELNPYQSVYAGASYRRTDALAVLLGFSMDISDDNNKGPLQGDPSVLKIGLSYDITTSSINDPSKGSPELWLNYCMFQPDPAVARYVNPFILQ